MVDKALSSLTQVSGVDTGDEIYLVRGGNSRRAKRFDSSLSPTFGGLNLVSGAAISWASGDVTITHSSNTLSFAGASSGYAFDNYIDLAEVAGLGAPAANVGRLQCIDDGSGITTLQLKDSNGNGRSISHFQQTGTGAVTRSQVSKLGDLISVIDFGADPTGTDDSRSAIQAAIDAAAAITTTRATVHFPSAGGGNSYKINSPLTWKPDVNIVLDPGVRIFAGASMLAMLQTETGNTERLRNVWLQGGRWDGAYLARRGIWVKDGEKVHLHDFTMRAIGTYTDGTSETESSYIRIGDTGQSTGCYEVVIDNFNLYRTDDAATPTPAPANNYGIYSTNGGSDCHVTNGVISGIKYGIADELAHWKIGMVHVWNFQATQGPLINGFYDSIGGVIISNCQVDCATYEVPFRIEGTNHPSVVVSCQIHCIEGNNDTGHAIEIGSGTQALFAGNTITCATGTRFHDDFQGSLTKLSVFGHENKNVVNSAIQPLRVAGVSTSEIFGHVVNTDTGNNAKAGIRLESNAGTAFFRASSSNGGGTGVIDWTGAGGLFIEAGNAGGKIQFQTDYTTRLTLHPTNGVLTSGYDTTVTMNESIVPAYQAHGTSTSGSSYGGVRWSADASGPQIAFGKSRNAAIGSHTVVQANDSIGRVRFEGSDGDQFIRGAQIEGFVDGTPGDNDMPGRLVFSTTADGASSSTEAMRIDSSQKVIMQTDRALRFNNHTSGAGASTGTLTNAPAAGNPTHWLKINIGGTNFAIPCWPG